MPSNTVTASVLYVGFIPSIPSISRIKLISSEVNPIEDIIKDKLFEKYEDENDDAFSELLDLHKNDMTNLWETVRSVVDYIEDDDDESDWDDFEQSLVEEDVENDNEE